MTASPARARGIGLGLLVIGVAAVSTGAIFARLAEAPPLAKATWRCGLATLVLALWAGPAGLRALARAPSQARALSMGAGAFLALHFATWIASLEYTSVATSLLLVNTTPVWVVLAAPRWNGERAAPLALVGVALALAGAAWLAFDPAATGGPGAMMHEGAETNEARSPGLLGPGLALVGAFGASGYFLLGRRIGGSLPLLGHLVLCYGTATVLLLSVTLVMQVPLHGFERETVIWLVALALVPQLIGHSACNAALRRLPALLVALPLLLEPVIGALLAQRFLGESPPPRAYGAGALVLLGVGIAAVRGPAR